jgi:trimeric autotransporter adhesin
MTRLGKILAISSPLLLLALNKADAQPVWIAGTPAVPSTGALTLTLNYGLDRTGTAYFIVYNFDNTSVLTSAFVRTWARTSPSGTIVATGSLSVTRSNIGKVLQKVINVTNPDQIHTIYIVAADSKSKLQASPVRLNATTLPCPSANAGTGGTECDLNFKLNAVTVFGTGVWTRISGPGTSSFSPNASTPGATVTVSAYGTYVFRWTETKGLCSSFGDVAVNFYRQPAANAGNGGNTCGLSFTLGATAPAAGTGSWTMTSGTGTASFSPDASAPTATATVSTYGTKVFTWTVVNGPCSGSSTVTVNYYQQPVADAGHGGSNCGLEFYLSAVLSSGTGVWTRVSGPGNAGFSPNAGTSDAKVTVTAYGSYVFRWTVTSGSCSASATVTVNFSQDLSANAGNGGDECDRDFKLNAVLEVGTGTWTKVNGPGVATFTPDANHPDALVTVSQYGDYDFAWTEISSSCSSVDIIRVVFHNPPSVNAGSDLAVCKGNSVQLNASGSGSFQWNPSKTLDNPAVQNPVATPDITTTYIVTLTDQWGCKNSDQVKVEVREDPVVNVGADQSLDYIFETNLEADVLNSGETGEWSVLSGTGEFSDKNNNLTKVSGLSLGKNSFLWSVSNGVCPESCDTVNITVKNLVVPTMITPNMDGRNDYFILKGIDSMGKTSLTIFDRWGSQVFFDNDYKNNWDGKDYNGNPLPPDTYFYILRPAKIRSFSGYIVIRR